MCCSKANRLWWYKKEGSARLEGVTHDDIKLLMSDPSSTHLLGIAGHAIFEVQNVFGPKGNDLFNSDVGVMKDLNILAGDITDSGQCFVLFLYCKTLAVSVHPGLHQHQVRTNYAIC